MPSKKDRPPCRSCGKPTVRKGQVCLECDPAVPPGRRRPAALRPERPCQGPCGKPTTAKNGWCRACEPTYMKPTKVGYEHAVYADAPGKWVNVRGIQRWVPASEVG